MFRRKIVKVSTDEQHTLVVKNGSNMTCLLFTETITGAELKQYLEEQCLWRLNDLPMTIDGSNFTADQVNHVQLKPETDRVYFGNRKKKSTAEFRREAGIKG